MVVKQYLFVAGIFGFSNKIFKYLQIIYLWQVEIFYKKFLHNKICKFTFTYLQIFCLNFHNQIKLLDILYNEVELSIETIDSYNNNIIIKGVTNRYMNNRNQNIKNCLLFFRWKYWSEKCKIKKTECLFEVRKFF